MCYSRCLFEGVLGECILSSDDIKKFGHMCLDDSIFYLELRREYKNRLKRLLNSKYDKEYAIYTYKSHLKRHLPAKYLFVKEEDLENIFKEKDNKEKNINFLFKEDEYFIFEVDDEVYRVKKEDLKEEGFYCEVY